MALIQWSGGASCFLNVRIAEIKGGMWKKKP